MGRMLVPLVIACGLGATPLSETPVASEVRAMSQEAYRAFRGQEFGRARELAEQTLARARARNDPREAGFAAANLAAALTITGRVDEALPLYDQAKEWLQEGGRPRERGRLAVARGLALYLIGEPEQGNRELERARTLLGAADWRRDFASVAIRYWADLQVGETFQAATMLLERARRAGKKERVAAALMVAGALQGSAPQLEEAMGLFEELGQPRTAALGLRNVGVVHLRWRELGAAEDQLVEALGRARTLGDKRLEFIVLNDLSVVRAQAGDDGPAREADLEAEALLAGLTGALQQRQVQATLMLDAYHLLRLRYLTMPLPLIDFFPWFFDQLALDPTEEEDEDR